MRKNIFRSDAQKRRENRKQLFWAAVWGVTFICILGLAGEQDRRAVLVDGVMPVAQAAPDIKRPVLVKAQGMIESRLNPYAKGDGGKSHGAFQIQPKIWMTGLRKKMPDDINEQAKINERIMDELLCEVDPMYALERYNGSGPRAREYARKVRREAFQIALLEVR